MSDKKWNISPGIKVVNDEEPSSIAMFTEDEMIAWRDMIIDGCIEAARRAYYRNGPDSVHNTAINMAIEQINALKGR